MKIGGGQVFSLLVLFGPTQNVKRYECNNRALQNPLKFKLDLLTNCKQTIKITYLETEELLNVNYNVVLVSVCVSEVQRAATSCWVCK